MVDQSARNDAEVESQVHNQGATYGGVGQVINGPQTVQVVGQAQTVAYSVPPEEDGIIAQVSRILHRHVGDVRANRFAWTSIVLGTLGLGPQLLQQPTGLVVVSMPLFWAGATFIAVGVTIRSALSFKAERTCPECNTHYALQEESDAAVEDVTVKEGVRRTTKRFFKCSECGAVQERVTRALIED